MERKGLSIHAAVIRPGVDRLTIDAVSFEGGRGLIQVVSSNEERRAHAPGESEVKGSLRDATIGLHILAIGSPEVIELREGPVRPLFSVRVVGKLHGHVTNGARSTNGMVVLGRRQPDVANYPRLQEPFVELPVDLGDLVLRLLRLARRKVGRRHQQVPGIRVAHQRMGHAYVDIGHAVGPPISLELLEEGAHLVRRGRVVEDPGEKGIGLRRLAVAPIGAVVPVHRILVRLVLPRRQRADLFEDRRVRLPIDSTEDQVAVLRACHQPGIGHFRGSRG